MKVPGSYAGVWRKPVGRWPIALPYLIGALALVPESHADEAGRRHTLGDLIALARRANPGVTANARASEAFSAQASEAVRSWLPTGELTSLLSPSPKIECYPSSRNCVGTDGPFESTVDFKGVFTRTQLNVSQPIFTFGRLTAGIDAAEASAQASRAREQAALAQLELNVKRAYYGFKLAHAVAMSLEEALGYVKRAEVLVQKDLDEDRGEMTITDKLRLQTTRIETEAQLLEVQRGAAIAKAGLRALIGPEAPSNLEIDDEPAPLPSLNPEPLSHYLEES